MSEMMWHIYPLARTGANRVLAAAEKFDDGRTARNNDGSLRIVTAAAPTEEDAMVKLQHRMARA